ncbi:TetR/AcrR family transcriptional regulator [Parahaliea mediterranea]|uniref:TetR/AcrR family transcriptional regulator n=1 Tax=Parahaliea mediterranea TaxID=651086 RepID=A0A939DHG3_9GAMM|nr:helix-turn-helix domain-containing protein [Parahaliea mediterranea]MBN7797587.1 TetR/AcrR family transcriptional regulator [Parahaliea mediterranea]
MTSAIDKNLAQQESLSEKGRQRRARVLAEAKRILLEEGMDGLALRKVAKQIDIKLGHLQYYFPTRDDLLEAIFREEWERDEAILLEAESLEGIGQVLASLMKAWAGDRGKVYLMLTLRSLYDERFRALKEEIYQTFYQDLVNLLAGVHPGKSKTDLLAKAKVITSMIDGAMIQNHSGSASNRRKQLERLYADLAELATEVAGR